MAIRRGFCCMDHYRWADRVRHLSPSGRFASLWDPLSDAPYPSIQDVELKRDIDFADLKFLKKTRSKRSKNDFHDFYIYRPGIRVTARANDETRCCGRE